MDSESIISEVSSVAANETTSENIDPSKLFTQEFWTETWNNFVNWCKSDGIKLVISIVILIIVFIVINFICKGIRKSLRRNKKTVGVANAVYRTLRTVLNAVALIVFLGSLGVDMAGVSSIIASCAVAIGLALQGSLANIAGWVILVVTRPFKLGDYITAQGQSGTVDEINLFFTHLRTPDNKIIFLPNGTLANGTIVNISAKDERRLDEVFSISYNDDPILAINTIKKVISKNKLIFKDPEPFVKVSEYADSAVNITVRVWLKSQDYWDVHWVLLSDVRKAFDEAGITIPFNQYDVNIVNISKESTSKKSSAKQANKPTTKKK